MADKKTFILYKSWAPAIKKMSDEQAGQLLKAMYSFQLGDEDAEPEDFTAQILFSIIREKMQEDTNAYKDTCTKRSENVRKRWNTNVSSEIQTDTKNTSVSSCIKKNTNVHDTESDSESDSESVSESEGIPPIAPRGEVNAVHSMTKDELCQMDVPPGLTEPLSKWIANRDAKNQPLTVGELQSLVSIVKTNANKYGAQAVSDLIGEAMANGYKGIPWDRLERRARDKPQKSALERLMEIEV